MLKVVLIVLLAAAALFGIYAVILVRPRARRTADAALFTDYAHRGLHGDGVPENSLAAFSRAVDMGFGIELDVQLSADGEVMVFHDYTLQRMTGCGQKLAQLTTAQLQELPLAGSDQTIPTLRQVLELVDGRVPLLIELKGEDLNTSLCQKTAGLLRGYCGAYCIESFNPLLVRAMKKQLPDAFYGQLFTNVCRDKKKYTPLNAVLSCMALNAISRPDFIAYNQKDRASLPVRLTTRLYGATKFVWTVDRRSQLDDAHRLGECAIFEKISPEEL